MFRFAVCSVLFVVCLSASAWANPSGYGAAPAQPSGYGAAPVAPAAPAAQVITLPQNAEAQAAALTNAAGAKASAAKIDALKWESLNQYGYQIGIPLLVKQYGPLTSLYAASLPPRSFVGEIDPAFVKDSYGKIKFIGETSIGVAAI